MLWEVDIHPGEGQPDHLGESIASDASELGLGTGVSVRTARGYLIEGDLQREQVEQIASQFLADGVVERAIIGEVGDKSLCDTGNGQLLHVLPKPGVTDAVAESAKDAILEYKLQADAVCTLRKYWVDNVESADVKLLATKLLANDSIEQVVFGPLKLDKIQIGNPYEFDLRTVSIREANDEQLLQLSRDWQLSMTLPELHTVQEHFKSLEREPTDVELETIAQTWSEHCSHKTLAGRIAYTDENGERQFENMLKETIFAATVQIRETLGADDWCVSVFKDNAGVIRFDDEYNLAFKVETHNRPSALEPYGGANTGIGGVIRDTLGTGLGAKPIANTDVFCFADPATPAEQLPPGVLHPKRIMHGVVGGVRDYGNRMGIPTVNGAIYFDSRYVGNPLVFCGNVGVLPAEKSFKEPNPGDLIVTMGGRTGRDGIHGATFSSVELTSKSEVLSGGAVQIGNAITEKMVTDVLLQARDEELFSAITDCGAGGFSSAVGEMGEEIGAEVWLDKAPLKYDGLSYTEIWISEAQERMVCAVPEDKWERFHELCESESVEATIIGKFEPTNRLVLKYHDHEVADLSMEFLHGGRPPVIREATYRQSEVVRFDHAGLNRDRFDAILLDLLGSPNIASKEWVIRQYDHEVQGGSVIKPLVGVANDGPGDAAVVRPRLDSYRGAVISCGMNPNYGDLDPFHMAASGIDEAIRNCVAVGADPDRIAILDNFCWGYTDRPETLGSLVRAALACQEMAIAFGTPFISGKDSLNNEYSYDDADGQRQTISIPSTLLISALGQVADVRNCVTMDLKKANNRLYVVGQTNEEMGGSHLGLVTGLTGGQVPQVNAEQALKTYRAMHRAIESGLVRSCHDASEGGLSVAIAEMAFAGGLGAKFDLRHLPFASPDTDPQLKNVLGLFSESNSRFIVEVEPQNCEAFEQAFAGCAVADCGEVDESATLQIIGYSRNKKDQSTTLIELNIDEMKQRWQARLQW